MTDVASSEDEKQLAMRVLSLLCLFDEREGDENVGGLDAVRELALPALRTAARCRHPGAKALSSVALRPASNDITRPAGKVPK